MALTYTISWRQSCFRSSQFSDCAQELADGRGVCVYSRIMGYQPLNAELNAICYSLR